MTPLKQFVNPALRTFFTTLLQLLREIADENAYARHLSAHGCIHSGQEWRRFSDEQLRRKYERAKCC